MDLQQYVPLAVKTESAKNPFTEEFVASSGMNIRMYHAIKGMCTEVDEMQDCVENVYQTAIDTVNMLEECGDFSWYQAIYEAAVPGTLGDGTFLDLKHYGITGLVQQLRKQTGAMLDHTKKVLMYGKPYDHASMENSMQICFALVNSLIVVCGSTPEAVRKINIDKLAKRYPEKFTEYDAEHRNLEEERAVLEGVFNH